VPDSVARPARLEPALLEGWLRLFANRLQPYALQQADGSYRWVYEPCTAVLLGAHLVGEITLAFSSTDARGWCRWACLDVDVPGSLPQLFAVRAVFAELGMPGLVEGSRRGGHLWLFFDELVPATAVRYTIGEALAAAYAAGVEVPTYEVYPDTGGAGVLGHAVRLPLGVHRRTGLRYPLYDPIPDTAAAGDTEGVTEGDAQAGVPCVFSSVDKAATFLLNAAPRIPARLARERWATFIADGGARGRVTARDTPDTCDTRDARVRPQTAPSPADQSPFQPVRAASGVRVGTRSTVIRWVDAHLSALELLEAFVPESDMRRVGRGYLGWCPFHNDRAPDTEGLPGTPSLYVVHDRRQGWSWRCLSTNCGWCAGPMKHSFRLFQELRGLSVSSAIVEACERWPEADASLPAPPDGPGNGDHTDNGDHSDPIELSDRNGRRAHGDSPD
jgi:hypothetical protein